MLLNIDENLSVNPEYIVVLQYDKYHNKDGEEGYQVMAKMIDGSINIIKQFKYLNKENTLEEQAKEFYLRLQEQINYHYNYISDKHNLVRKHCMQVESKL